MDDEFQGMETVFCPKCRGDIYHRKMTEIAICKVYKDEHGYHDAVEYTADPTYDFKCAKCGRDGLEGKA